GGCRSGGRSSRKSRGQASASTTRRFCGLCTQRADSRPCSWRPPETAAEQSIRSAEDGPNSGKAATRLEAERQSRPPARGEPPPAPPPRRGGRGPRTTAATAIAKRQES